MNLNKTVSSERIHIGFFGMRNAGKSSLVNAFTNQELSLVSDIKGTTTDPVKKSMELLPLGPVVIIDTPGLDDEGKLGEMRIKKAKEILSSVDIAVLVIDAEKGKSKKDKELIGYFEDRKTPYILAYNKADLLKEKREDTEKEIYLSALKKENIDSLKEAIAKLKNIAENKKTILSDLAKKGDTIILVIPTDKSAPKGRLILPQQQTIREILDIGAFAVSVSPDGLADFLNNLKEKPKLVITDSQAFREVNEVLPSDIPLTSFSILFARYKGELVPFIKGSEAIDSLKNGDKILISEACTHHRQCGDIGRDKIPMLLKKYTGKDLSFEFSSGNTFPENLDEFEIIIHCGGCMITEKEMKRRMEEAEKKGKPIVNYGMAIAKMNGILERSLEVFEK